MTYFNYRKPRGARSEQVYAGSSLVGRVAVRTNWRARITLSAMTLDLFYAVGVDGEELPGLFASRHDAAEALYEIAFPTSAEADGLGADRTG